MRLKSEVGTTLTSGPVSTKKRVCVCNVKEVTRTGAGSACHR